MGEINKIKSILNTSHAHVQPFFSKSVLCDVCECVCLCVCAYVFTLCVSVRMVSYWRSPFVLRNTKFINKGKRKRIHSNSPPHPNLIRKSYRLPLQPTEFCIQINNSNAEIHTHTQSYSISWMNAFLFALRSIRLCHSFSLSLFVSCSLIHSLHRYFHRCERVWMRHTQT